MQICVTCGASFPITLVIDGIARDFRGRKRCLLCRPYRPLRKPRKPVPRQPKRLVCKACGRVFPAKMVIEGRVRSLYRRSFCLECSPFGSHNTSRAPIAARLSPNGVRLHAARRREQFRRSLNKRRRARKALLVAEFGGCCVDCGYATATVLQFHQRARSSKSFRIGSFNGSLVRLREEAAKCDLLCPNCHRSRHAAEAAPATHRVVELRRETKRRAVNALGGRCGGCGGLHVAAAFDLHHIDGKEKSFGLADGGINRRWDVVLAELGKCILLCANCHAEVHAGLRTIAIDPVPAVAVDDAARLASRT